MQQDMTMRDSARQAERIPTIWDSPLPRNTQRAPSREARYTERFVTIWCDPSPAHPAEYAERNQAHRERPAPDR